MEERELPVGWSTSTIEDISIKVGSGATPKGGEAAYKPTGIPLIRSTNVVFFGFKQEGLAFIDSAQADALSNATVNSGDVLLNITGASIGRVTTAPDWADGARVNQHVCIIRPGEAITADYLAAFLSSPEFQSYVWSDNYGVTRQALTKKQILEVSVPLPPQAEQRRIAAKLDFTLAAVDSCRHRLEGVAALIKRFRQAVLEAATTGELTREWREENPEKTDARSLAQYLANNHQLSGGHRTGNAAPPTTGVHDLDEQDWPAGWALVCLRDLVKPERPITYGILKPGPELVDGVPYVRVADYPGDRLNTGSIRKTSNEIDEAYKRSRLQAGDLLLSIRGTVGRLITIPKELEGANITQDSARLSVQDVVETSYVEHVLRSETVQSRMRRAIKGVAVRGINIGDVRALQIPLPSLEEQGEISRRVSELLTLADQLESKLNAARQVVERLTPALLAKAFRGELVPQDPFDEPASVLLERIRAARQAESGAGKPSRRGRRSAAATPAPGVADAAPAPPDLLATLLRECGALSHKALLAASELEPDRFEAQRELERQAGRIRRIWEDGEALWEAVG